ncbi:phosphate transport system permease protein [Caldovatus sediminis]|uniref:Phosphate transport system permease protein n=1 Tax=Caldovatus sediminis TaxID=2041189 RepID=A0A8J2Z9K9_9PROT|nr:phosphate ABC transporter permease subunit PstC [Caldovatus sediminis]GGG24803.1 phosphate transport system permease protein [Caldovatus sediminis]
MLEGIPARQRAKERAIEGLLFLAGVSSILVTTAIAAILIYESSAFFREVSVVEFLTDTMWTPLFAEPRYGILPLLAGTVLSASVGLLVAIPLGLTIAIYLSEFASERMRETVKPVLELLAGIPTVVFGYFALFLVTPLLQRTVLPDLPGFNVLSAGIVIGIMIVPYVSSLAEDAMRAVPMSLREGSFAMGANRVETALKVVVPAAFSGIAAACILAASRAVGETMVVAIAAGQQPNLTLDPTQPAATITAYIVQVSLGDLPHASIGYQSIFAAGLTLFVLTLLFNLAGHALRRRFREIYE